MKKLLYLIFFCFVFISYRTQAQIPTNGMIAYYPFDGNATDKSGNNFNGTVTGATLTTDRFGNANSAYSFNGTSNYISVADNNTLDIGVNDYSLVSWIKTSATGQGRIISKGSTNCTPGYMMRMHGPGIWVENATRLSSPIRDTCLSFTSTGIAVNSNKWRCVVNVVKRNSYSRIYVDGVLYRENIRNTSSFDLSNTADLRIGINENPTTYPEWFNGSIDDIRVYNRALTDAEISSIYNEPDYKSCRYQDSLQLVSLYNTTGGANWTNKWDLTQPMTAWYGVTLNTEGCVQCIDLDGTANCIWYTPIVATGNNLVGSLPNLTLPNLETFVLNNNKLSGSIPSFSLPNLKHLFLSNNQLNGLIPNLNLPNLEDFACDSNQLTGNLPNLNLPNLKYLDISDNQLTGTIPNFNLPNLQFLILYNNQLSGTIPNFNLPELKGLYISTNKLSGQIPNFNLPKLQQLYAYSNPLTASTLPNFDLPELLELDFSDCQLNTPLINFTGVPKLQVLYLYLNQLTGAIPSFNLPNLKTLHLYNNQLSNVLPELNVPQLSEIQVQNNLLTGCFPASYRQFCPIPSAEKRNFSGNAGLPNGGDFTAFCTNNSGICQDTNSCRYQDSIALVRFYNATNGQNWTSAYRWDFSKSMENWKGVGLNAQGCVECLDLDGDASVCNGWSDNPPGVGLSGTFPTAIGKLTNLYRLHLRGNRNLTGQIPDSIRYLTKLAALYLDGTGISGLFSDGFRGLVNLVDFSGYNTPYNNTIPDLFDNIKNLEAFDFSDTQTSGTIPPSLVKTDSLRRLFLARNKMTGTVPIELASRLIHRLDLSDNDFDSLPKLNLVKWDVPFVGDPFVSLQGNRFTFDDIVPNIKSLSTDFAKTYAPQDSIFKDTTITVRTGAPLSIDLKIDGGISDNVYSWERNGSIVISDGSRNVNRFIRNAVSLADAGVYTCKVTNTNAPLLTLYSKKINVVVNPDTNSCRYRDSLVLLDFYKAMNGNSWKRKDNWLSSEPISNWYGVYVGLDSCVVTLDFDGVSDGDGNGYTGNGLNGVFPASICNLSELRNLYLSANTNLSGSIPNIIGRLSKLTNLHFNFTSISGALPDSLWTLTQIQGLSFSGCKINSPLSTKIGNLSNLGYLIASDCNLTGTLPTTIANLKKMRYFLVANNPSLSGTLPTDLSQMTVLEYFNLGGNALTGNIPNSVGQLKNLHTLILGGNKLANNIPNEIGNCTNLEGLYISDNTNLTGNIPTSIGNLKRLKYLWLQGNMLSGEIPAIIGSMDSLEDVILSRNKFTGKIDASFNRLKVKRLHFDNNLIDSVPSLINIPLADSIAVASLGGQLQVAGLTIDNNALTFDDILPNRNFLNTAYLKYIPQKTFFKDTSITLTTGCDLELDLKIDVGIKDNTYKWFQSGNSNVKYSSTINKLILKNIQPSDAGDYTCQVTNPGALGLTLFSKTITLKVIPPVSTTRNKTICFGQRDTLPKGRIISTTGTYRDTLKNRNGCDSAIIVTNLTVAPIRVEKSTQNICWGTNLKIKDSLVTKGGIYRDTLRSAEGCITVNEVTVIIDSIKVVKEDSFCKGQEYLLPSGTMVNKIGEYQDTVKRAGQCDTIYTVILKEGCLPLVKVYNGITPDGDDNKYLVVEEIVDYPKSQLFIYSRTNDLIFRSAIPYDNKWNGTDQNGTPLPADTYYYILDLGLPNQKPLKGYILLMR